MSLFYLGHPNDHDLALFAGGELGPVARWRIEKHLQNCSRCEEAVADFFHLQSELGELSELPNIDWSAQSQMILDRAERARASTAPTPSLGHSWALRAGLAMATVICAVVIVRQFPLQKAEPELASKTMLSRAVQDQVAVQAIAEPRANSEDIEETRAAAPRPAEAPALSEADSAENKQVLGAQFEAGESNRTSTAEEFASARRESALAPDLPAPSGPAGLRKTQVVPQAPPVPEPAIALAYRGRAPQDAEDKRDAASAQALLTNERAGRDQAAPAVTQSAENLRRIPGQVAAEAPGDEFALADRADRQVPSREQGKEKAELESGDRAAAAQKGQAPVRIAAARATGGAVASYANTAPTARPGAATRYSISPVTSGSQVETGVAADGAISFRTVDAATGAITITHVYAQ
jgi:hypothetical protein